MNEQKQKYINWIKTHKKELIVAGGSISAIIAIVYCYQKRGEILKYLKNPKFQILKLPFGTNSSLVVESIGKSAPTKSGLSLPQENRSIVPIRKLESESFDVLGHIRNLHDGWHASAAKIVAATERGYELLPGQTWVNNYTKTERLRS